LVFPKNVSTVFRNWIEYNELRRLEVFFYLIAFMRVFY